MIPRVIFDTNIWVSYLLRRRGAIAWLVKAHWPLGDFVLLTADTLLDELVEVLARPEFAELITAYERYELLQHIRSRSEVLAPLEKIPALTADPKDDMFVAYAIAGKADYIITRDAHLLDLGQVGNVRIITPDVFQSMLARAKKG
jgi:putative PIN family toxin of toxin-antitoxin system